MFEVRPNINTKAMLIMALVILTCFSGQVLGATVDYSSLDQDNDGVADDTERWIIDNHPDAKDNNDVAVSPTDTNLYVDQDYGEVGDGIMDIVEQYVTHTPVGSGDDGMCTNGHPAHSGQRAMRMFHVANADGYPSNRDDSVVEHYQSGWWLCIEQQEVNFHVEAYHPSLGYADSGSSSFVPGDATTADHLIVVWPGDITMTADYVPTGNQPHFLGQINIDGENYAFRSSRNGNHTPEDYLSFSAIYALQVKELVNDDAVPGTVVQSPRNPGSMVAQLTLDQDITHAVIYNQNGRAIPAYIVPRTGSLHVASLTANGDEDEVAALMFKTPTNGVRGGIRGEIYTDGTRMNFFAEANNPITRHYTYTSAASPGETFTSLSVFNIPLSADSVRILDDGQNELAAFTVSLNRSIRNRIPALTANGEVGVAGNGNNHFVSQFRLSDVLLQPGQYTVEVTDGENTLDVPYTIGALPEVSLEPVSDLAFNGMTGTEAEPIVDVGAGLDHTVSWTRVADATNEILMLRAVDGEPLSFSEADLFFMFSAAENCTGNDCSMTIDAGLMDPERTYCFKIQSRRNDPAGGNNTVRSRSDDLCLTTAAAEQGGTGEPGGDQTDKPGDTGDGGDTGGDTGGNNTGDTGGGGGGGASLWLGLLALLIYAAFPLVRVYRKIKA